MKVIQGTCRVHYFRYPRFFLSFWINRPWRWIYNSDDQQNAQS